jgi:hypothetical protein
LASLVDGTFIDLEGQAGAVPFKIDVHEFTKLFVLVDGIYPNYSRFVKGMKEPITIKEKLFTAWQEACRKDIERAFGVLQAKFQVIARPIHLMKLQRIANKVATCMILHNMCVSDRVMGDPKAYYNPAYEVEVYAEDVEVIDLSQPPDILKVQEMVDKNRVVEKAVTGVWSATKEVQSILIKKRKVWSELKNEEEHIRLHKAIMDFTIKNRP